MVQLVDHTMSEVFQHLKYLQEINNHHKIIMVKKVCCCCFLSLWVDIFLLVQYVSYLTCSVCYFKLPNMCLGGRTAQAIVDEALKSVQRVVKDRLSGRGGGSKVSCMSTKCLCYQNKKNMLFDLPSHT